MTADATAGIPGKICKSLIQGSAGLVRELPLVAEEALSNPLNTSPKPATHAGGSYVFYVL